MIADTVVDEIYRLLLEPKPRLSERQIAKHLGVSRGTVRRIKSGARPDRRWRLGKMPPSGPWLVFSGGVVQETPG